VRHVLGYGRPYLLALEKLNGLDVVCAVRAEAMVGRPAEATGRVGRVDTGSCRRRLCRGPEAGRSVGEG
jgi:hypothetical protein